MATHTLVQSKRLAPEAHVVRIWHSAHFAQLILCACWWLNVVAFSTIKERTRVTAAKVRRTGTEDWTLGLRLPQKAKLFLGVPGSPIQAFAHFCGEAPNLPPGNTLMKRTSQGGPLPRANPSTCHAFDRIKHPGR